jgi:hypothetical protein
MHFFGISIDQCEWGMYIQVCHSLLGSRVIELVSYTACRVQIVCTAMMSMVMGFNSKSSLFILGYFWGCKKKKKDLICAQKCFS